MDSKLGNDLSFILFSYIGCEVMQQTWNITRGESQKTKLCFYLRGLYALKANLFLYEKSLSATVAFQFLDWIQMQEKWSHRILILSIDLLFKDLFIIVYKYTVAVFRHTRRGCQISLQMVVSHHVVAKI